MALVPPSHVADDYKKHDGRNAGGHPVLPGVRDRLGRVGRDLEEEVASRPSRDRHEALAIPIDADQLEYCAEDGRESGPDHAEYREERHAGGNLEPVRAAAGGAGGAGDGRRILAFLALPYLPDPMPEIKLLVVPKVPEPDCREPDLK